MNDFLDETNSQDYKYMMIKVPDYKGTRDDAASLVSYLRLGATPSTGDGMPEEGADLFAHAEAQLDGMPEGLFFDDERVRAGSPGATTTDERKSVSARMVEDCGWRDHSDGNRITTTRGDKIEVIRGNYKLLVLGRQDDPNEGVYLDASGGLLQTGDIAPGAISSIRWVQDPALGGTWAVLEEAEKGHVTNIYHGRVREEFYGPELTTVVGSAEAAMALTPIALIPQVVMGGLLVPMTNKDWLDWPMAAMPSRWGFESMVAAERETLREGWDVATCAMGVEFVDLRGRFDCAIAEIASGHRGALGFANWDSGLTHHGALVAMTVLCLAAVVALLRRRDTI